MSDAIDRALEAVVETARAHLAAVREHGVDAAPTNAAYDKCADAVAVYERALSENFGEAAPWSVAVEDDDEADGYVPGLSEDVDLTPIGKRVNEEWVAVRVRADYFVEDEDALYAAAEARAQAVGMAHEWTPVKSVPDAFAVLLGAAVPVINALDVPGLMRGNGTTTVTATNAPLVEADLAVDADEQAPFILTGERPLAVIPDLVPEDDEDGDLSDEIDLEDPLGTGRVYRDAEPAPLSSQGLPVDEKAAGLGWMFRKDRD